jgi:hypothetical protein
MKSIMRFFILTCLISFPALAQHSAQSAKESSEDLRTGSVMFSILDMGDKSMVWLERTASMDYFLRRKHDGDDQILKISGSEAKKLDREFAGKFLKCQYEFAPSPDGCQVTLRLTMKGEGQDICGKDDKKAQEIEPFAKAIRKRF